MTDTDKVDTIVDNDEDDDGSSSSSRPVMIWELPEVLIYHIACFVAPPTKRSHVLIHKIALLCRAASRMILEEARSTAIWDLVLKGDYGISNNSTCDNTSNGRSRQQRSCKRLRRSPVNRVRDAQGLIQKNTEIAYFYLWELSYENTSIKRGSNLTKRKLCGILQEYGPQLLINETVSSGGTFLVEVCRSRHTTQHIVLQCVQELVENQGAEVNLQTNESANSCLTPLCVAAARGMPKVVKYLLSKGASKDILCSARFRLYKNPKKSVRCTKATPLEFATTMIVEEQREGATAHEVANLKACIKLLSM